MCPFTPPLQRGVNVRFVRFLSLTRGGLDERLPYSKLMLLANMY